MTRLNRIAAHPFIGIILVVSILMNNNIYTSLHTCEEELLSRLYISTIINTVFFTSLLVVLLFLLRFIKSWQLVSCKERIPVILGMMIFFFWSWLVASEHECLHFILTQCLLGAFLATIFMILANSFASLSFYAVCFGSILFNFFISTLIVPDIWSEFVILLLFFSYAFTQVIYLRSYIKKREWVLGFLIGFSSQAIALLLK